MSKRDAAAAPVSIHEQVFSLSGTTQTRASISQRLSQLYQSAVPSGIAFCGRMKSHASACIHKHVGPAAAFPQLRDALPRSPAKLSNTAFPVGHPSLRPDAEPLARDCIRSNVAPPMFMIHKHAGPLAATTQPRDAMTRPLGRLS